MAQIGDAKGEYRGIGGRNDAELKAWLAKRPSEAALEPALPIIDPHHHFWDTPQRGRYLLPELLTDIGGGHNIVSTVFLECRSMYKKDGPAGDGAGRRGRIRQRHRGDERVGRLWPVPRRRGDHRPCRPDHRRAGPRGAGGRDQGRRRAFPRYPSWRLMGPQRRDPEIRHARRAAASGARHEIPRGVRPARPARAQFRILAVPSAIAGCDRSRPRPFPTRRSSSITSAACSASAPIPATGRRFSPAGKRTSSNWPSAPTSTSSSAASA